MIEGDPLALFIESLDRVADLDGVTIVLPAHGHPFTDLPGRVDEIKEHHDERLEQIHELSARAGLGQRGGAVAHRSSPTAPGARWPRARPTPTSSTSACPARPSAATKAACSSTSSLRTVWLVPGRVDHPHAGHQRRTS